MRFSVIAFVAFLTYSHLARAADSFNAMNGQQVELREVPLRASATIDDQHRLFVRVRSPGGLALVSAYLHSEGQPPRSMVTGGDWIGVYPGQDQAPFADVAYYDSASYRGAVVFNHKGQAFALQTFLSGREYAFGGTFQREPQIVFNLRVLRASNGEPLFEVPDTRTRSLAGTVLRSANGERHKLEDVLALIADCGSELGSEALTLANIPPRWLTRAVWPRF